VQPPYPPPYQPPYAAAAPQGIRVCPGCGVIAPFGRTACGVCETPFGPAAPVAPGRVGSLLFACIHGCDFTCKACGIRSPLGTIELEGQVECWGCGLNQAFDAVQWTDALGHAHDVADLSGPNPEGQNPVPGRPIAGRSKHAAIGTQYTSSTKTQNSLIMDGNGTRTHSLRTTVSPGHPLCKTCRVPLEVSIEASGATRTRCPRCSDSATYTLPANAASTCGALRGIVAGEQRTDQPIARVTRGQGGVEAPGCPQCGAALAAGDGDIVKCTFCSITARVPGKLARRQRKGQAPKMEPFWVLLDGISPGRKKLLQGRDEDDDDDDDDDDDQAFAPSGFGPGGFGPPGYPPQATPGVPAWAHPNLQRGVAPPKKSNLGLIIGVCVVLLLLLIGGGVAGLVFYNQLEDDDPPAKTTPKPTKPAKPGKK
jgi:hypothetical protein